WHIGREALMASDFPAPAGDAGGGDELQLKAEQALTGAIVQVTSGRATRLCATQGHGEWSLDEGTERSYGGLKRALHHDNIEWQPFESLGQKRVPAACDAVMVVGPLQAFSEVEAKLLIDYVRGGGNLLLALDPVLENDQVKPTGFEAALRDLGIRLDSALVLELNPEHLLTRNAAEFLVTEFGDHPTTRSFQHAARVFMSLARSITPIAKDGGIDILMRTSDKGFGKTAINEVSADAEPKPGPSDIAGPVTVAVATQLNKTAGESPKPGGRLIVVGDSDFMQGPLLDAPELANFHLASAFVGWLSERPALIEIPPKKIRSGNIVFSQEDLWSVFFRVAVLVPAAALILGIAVWLNRRA
ncbi:MAG TPA: Gldg family protein, partial [Polyangiales bacterium]|nr:Gldg family protein [Polyangiales bacterium]